MVPSFGREFDSPQVHKGKYEDFIGEAIYGKIIF